MTRAKRRPAQRTKKLPERTDLRVTFHEHLKELRRRVFLIAASVATWSLLAYAFQHQIVKVLLKPSHGQSFVYTSPIGGIDFLFRVSLYTGLILSTPIIVYEILKFASPLMKHETEHFAITGSIISGILALIGVLFGYFVGLPSALHFLLHQFVTGQIKPLITIQSYMSFVMVYMVGAALMLQIPLIVIFINRIKPLNPKGLFKYERWVIVLAFIMSGLMNPTPNVFDQLIVAGPIIIMYQVSIGIVALINKPRWRKEFFELYNQDLQAQAERMSKARTIVRI